jgi:hypothetical protein
VVFKDGPFFCQPVNIWREDILSSIESTIGITKIIDQQKNNVGFFVLGMGLHADAQEGYQQNLRSLAQGG